MRRLHKFSCFVLSLSIAWMLPLLLFGGESQDREPKGGSAVSAVSGFEKAAVYPSMAAPGKKVPFGNDFYLIYGFDKKPKLGTLIMKVEVFDKAGKKDVSFEAKADAGMPSMKGAHETGDRPFVLSKKGDYLLPINIVMPGDWEIRLTILKEGKVVFKGSYQFDV